MAKPKTLKELNDLITKVQSTVLENRLGNTIMGAYFGTVDGMYKAQLSTKLGTISIPSLQCFETHAPGLRNQLIALYDSQMKGVKGADAVSDDLKFAQGALLDGLCYVYDMETGNVTLATMNFDLLSDLDIDFDMRKQIITKNANGFCKAFRIDVEYINGDKEFTFKAVNARNYDIDEAKPDDDPTKKFVLAPYIAGIRMMKLCEQVLKTGGILRVRQSTDGMAKIRYCSTNRQLLQKYCDDPSAVADLVCNYYPLRCFMYVPVVGAPSTTAMMTRINLFDIDNIRGVSEEQMVKDGVRKPQNPVRSLIGERYFIASMLTLKKTNLEEFKAMLKRLSYQGKLVKNPEKVDAKELSAYLHGVTPAAVEKAYRLAGVEDSLEAAMFYFTGTTRPMTEEELKDLPTTLKNNVCKFTIRKSDCTFGAILATNDKGALRRVYGKDYFGIYESFSARFAWLSRPLKELRNRVNVGEDCSIGSEAWVDFKDYCEFARMPIDDNIYEDLVLSANEKDEESFLRHAKAMYASLMDVSLKRSEAASNAKDQTILCRSITAYVDEEGKVVEYYKNLDATKIVRALIIE